MRTLAPVRFAQLLAQWLLFTTLAACATTPAVVYQRDKQGGMEFRKRYARYVAVDLIHRFLKNAYRPALGKDFNERSLSEHQKTVVADLGRPELVRRPFKSRENELVEEWAYPEKRKIVQFVEGQLAYEGPLTDYERVLIEHGYPHSVTEVQVQGGGERAHWIYEDSWFLRVKSKTFDFTDGKLVYQQEMY